MIEKKIQQESYSHTEWRELRKRIERWWKKDLDAESPRKKPPMKWAYKYK